MESQPRRLKEDNSIVSIYPKYIESIITEDTQLFKVEELKKSFENR